MKDLNKKEKVGLLCLILGGLFLAAGLVFFVLINFRNLSAKKVQATILTKVSIYEDDSDKKQTLLTVMYPVGTENVTTSFTYDGEFENDSAFMTLYYDARNPKVVMDAGWYFEPVFLAALGLLLFLCGLYYKGVTNFGIVERKKPDDNAPENEKKIYELSERSANGLFPAIGGFFFIVFGVLMLILRHNYWMWAFIVIGILAVLYFGYDMIPAMLELHRLKVAQKFKGRVVDTDKDLKKADKKSEKKSKSLEEEPAKTQKEEKNEEKEESAK
ncbi:MAG: hypothetical protein IKP92_05055 [Lachnospiraceae bacterium]|nr:hypothetical protein [Lachnospiraceae bacterium]